MAASAGATAAMQATERATLAARRHHGCEMPLHPSQIVVVGIVVLAVVVFYGLSVQELPAHMQRTVVLLFGVQLAVTTLLFVVISLFDPAAQLREQGQPKSRHKSSSSKTTMTVTGGGAVTTPYAAGDTTMPTPHAAVSKCNACGAAHKVGASTKYCARCHKCVAGFDHHCVYLNTCIGRRNYPLFAGLLSCTILLLVTQQVITGYAVSRLLSVHQGSGSGGHGSRAALLCVLSVLPLLELFCMVVLASFHLYIAFLGLTTYEWLYRWYERRDAQQAAVAAFSADTMRIV